MFSVEGQAVHGAFLLGEHRVLPTRNRIVRDGDTIGVEPKVMDVLVCLAKADDVISREALIAAVWGDVVVTDHVLSRCISELRKALGDDPRAPRFVETIRSRGYRLIQRPEPLPASPRSADRPTPPRRSARSTTLLVVAGLGVVLASIALLRPGPIDPVARTEIPVTAMQGSELDPAISPDGSRIAFAWRAPDASSYDIYVKTFHATEPLRLTQHPGEDKNPAWSPDGERVAFVRAWVEGSGLWVVPARGGPPRRLHTTVSGNIPDLIWTPDGAALIYVDRPAPSRPYAVMRLDLATLEHTALSAPPDHFFGDRDLALSPRGDRIAFARGELEGIEDLFVIDLEGGAPATRLTRDRTSITGIEWITDRRILFSSSRVDATRLWEVALDGGTPLPVRSFGERASDPHLSADGRLVYERRNYRIDIWRARRNADGTWRDAEPLITSTRADTSPSFSPDDTRIAFVTDRSGEGEIWICDRDGRHPERITAVGDTFPPTLSWSPDGSQIAFVRSDGDHQKDIWVTATAGGATQRLTDSPDLEVTPRWSRDGRSLYFGSDRSGEWQIWRLEIGTGSLTQITRNGGLSAVESEQWLYYVRTDQATLFRVPHTGGDAEQVLRAADPGRRCELAPIATGIYLRTPTPPGGPDTVTFFEFATETSRAVPNLELQRSIIPQLGFSVSSDGSTVLFTGMDISDSDILMVEGFR